MKNIFNNKALEKAFHNSLHKPASINIIIVTYNSSKTIKKCIESLLLNLNKQDLVTIIDNKSKDNTRDIIDEYDQVNKIYNNKNVGFAKGVNLGFKDNFSYTLLLNPDTILFKDWRDGLLSKFFSRNVAAVGPISDYAANDQNLDFHLNKTNHYKVSQLMQKRKMKHEKLKKIASIIRKSGNSPLSSKILTGFCLLIRSSVFKEMDLLDEKLFLGCDDLDLSWRLRLKGYELIISSNTFVHHIGQQSFNSRKKETVKKLSQKSADFLNDKLISYYGQNNVPTPIELWGIDWFTPLNPSFNENAKINDKRTFKTAPLISIIIPVFNKLKLTKKCIFSILNSKDYSNYELLIVDNGSNKETNKYLSNLEQTNPQIKLIVNKKNQGFAKANNQAAKFAKGKYLYCLNNDTEVKKHWLSPLVKILEKDENVAAVGSKLIFPDETLQHAGIGIANSKQNKHDIIPFHINYKLKADSFEVNIPKEVSALTAASLLIRKKIFQKVDGFDENFWNGYEDLDLCFKVQQLEKKLVYEPKSQLIHLESQSGPERFSKNQHNINYLYNKWYKKIHYDIDIFNNPNKIKFLKNSRIKDYIFKQKNEPVSIVLLTFNALKYTKMCIESVFENTLYPFELIIIDNNSSDNTKNYLRELTKKHNNVIIQINSKNVGFSKGNNQGVKLSKFKYVMILNNDTLVPKGWLTKMMNSIKKDSKIGMVGPVSNSISGRQQIKPPYQKTEEFFNYARKRIYSNKFPLSPRRRLAGFCLLIRKNLYIKVGGFSEEYLIGNFEDDDLSLKVRSEGFSLMVDENVMIHHYGSISFSENTIDYKETINHNNRIFQKKWPSTDYEELIEIKNNLVDVFKNNIEKSFNYFQSSKFEKSEKIIDSLIKLNPISEEALYIKSLIENEKGNYSNSAKILDKIISLYPKSVGAITQKGILNLQKNNLNEALKYFDYSIKLDPTNIDSYKLRSEVYVLAKNFQDAIESIIETLNIFPEDISSLERLSSLYLETSNEKEAMNIANLILQKDKKNIFANNLTGHENEK